MKNTVQRKQNGPTYQSLHDTPFIIVFISEENDYSMAFYAADGLLFITLLSSLAVRVTIGTGDEDKTDAKDQEKKKKENRRALKKLFSPSAMIFFAMIFQGGLMWGVKDTYFFLYCQEELGATSQFIGYVGTISTVCGVLIMPFAKWIIESVGNVHLCYVAIMVDCVRLVVVSIVQWVFSVFKVIKTSIPVL